ncbi:MAG TPA: MopE-related protein [Myxococcota bacterium]|nr:MopE-related protein [Myxococcota bacterium]
MLWLLSCALITEGDREQRMDNDGDGWELPQDCDDGDDTVYPNRAEECNGIDDDCDGDVDEGLDVGAWYLDADEDGYGDPEQGVDACEGPEGYVDNGDDCDDGEQFINPAAEELCNDGIDNNCFEDGKDCRLAGELSHLDADAALFGSTENGGVGWSIHAVPDLGPRNNALVIGAPGWSGFTGSAYVVLEPKEGQQYAESGTAAIRGIEGSELGFSIDHVPPLDGEGPELILGAPGVDLESGRVYRVDTPVFGEVEITDIEGYVYGADKGVTLGYAVAGSGDLSGDGQPDIAISSPSASSTYSAIDPGRVTVHDAALTEPVRDGDATGIVTSSSITALFGYAVEVADVDSDGADDLIVGAPYSSEGTAAGGEVSVFLGPIGVLDVDDRDAAIMPNWPGDNLGAALAADGDLNLDGYVDILVGAPGSSIGDPRAGVAALFTGPVDSGEAELSDAVVLVLGEDGQSTSGCAQCVGGAVANLGDIDQDGYGDVAVGAGLYTRNGPTGSDPSAVLLYGGAQLGGTFDYTDSDLLIEGGRSSAFGGAVALAGDANADGVLDLAVGAATADGDETSSGAVFLFWGSAP